jgi:predicted ArsR family transcriptional regulator
MTGFFIVVTAIYIYTEFSIQTIDPAADFVKIRLYNSAMAKKASPRSTGTRRELLNLLKRHGPLDSAALAAKLGVGAMAVRQHVYDLQARGMITFKEEARPVGRPAKLWRLTEAANRHFPDSHAELTVGLIDAMRRALGNDSFERVLEERMRAQTAAYRKHIDANAPLKERMKALARLRSAEGYMAAVSTEADGALLLVENHCPICDAAKACVNLCARELETFQALLGPDVRVERTEHVLAGARRCAYRVERSDSGS